MLGIEHSGTHQLVLYVTVPYSHTKGCTVWVRLTKDASSKAKGKETPAE